MKKAIIIIAALTLKMSLTCFSQETYVVSANVALQQGFLDEAKDDIDKAMANPKTSESPKALWSKAQIYYALIGVEKYKAANPSYECVRALIALAEIKPDYEKAGVNQQLLHFISTYYNDGVKAYNDKDNSKRYIEVPDTMKVVVKMCDLNAGKRFENLKAVDTIKAKANMIIANSTYYSGKYEEAIPLLTTVKNNPITKTPVVYENLIDACDKTKNMPMELAAIQEARAAFPDNKSISDDELNYYIVTGKQNDLLKKLEEDAAKDPNNADLQFSIAIAYSGLANPKTGKQPENKTELLAKSEDAFQKAVKLAPDNAEFSYSFGVLYYYEGKDVNDQMNAITGSSDADLKKYDVLKVKRDGYFEKALPYFDKAYNLLDAQAATLKSNEKTVYIGAMQALSQIYAIQSKMDKADALKKKIAEVK